SKQLKKDELYIDYAKTEKEYYIFTIDSSSNVNFIAIDKNSSKEIDGYIKAFRANIDMIVKDTKLATQKSKHSKEILSKLYQATIQKPLGDILKEKSSLIISTDGALRAMPFEAMYDTQDQKYLIEQKNIRYISSGRELVRLFRYSKQHKSEDIAVIFSNPNFDANISDTRTARLVEQDDIAELFELKFGALKGTIEEAKRIEKILKKDNKVISYSQTDANETTLLEVKKPKILHLATHGFFINDKNIPNPMLKSGIVLSGANYNAFHNDKDYGVVTALKLSGLNLKGTDLAVLSACSTGVVDLDSTENISGLSKAFIQAGAKDVVMSLWEVDDMKTMELMSSFYKNSQKSHNYAKALRATKIEMIKVGLHPYYWSPFILSGM
ncbi:CHAT domain-containing protein, partial [Sulfurovum sp. bin170]|uniref:CHAT domain-containing protein n=1 Tax=Sulfurovum sp. bin170 TaxID=2695268 RepID=UPI0013E0AF85